MLPVAFGLLLTWTGWAHAAATGAPSSSFRFDLACTSAEAGYCDNVKKTLELAGSYVEDVVSFSSTIQVNATVVGFANDGFLSQGRPSSTLVVKDSDGRVRLYPQALIRGKTPRPAVQEGQEMTKYDVEILINSNTPAYFPASVTGSSKAIGKEEVDLSWTLTHELLHGLGHLTAWRDHTQEEHGADAKGASNTSEYLTPYPFVYMVRSGSTGAAALQYDGHTYPYLFDRFLVETTSGKALDDYITAIDGVGKAGTTFADGPAFVSAVAGNGPAASAASKVSTLAKTPGSVSFRLDDGSLVTLDTDPALPSSRLDHLGPEYEKKEDLLMYSVTPSGLEYIRALKQAGSRHPIGEKTQSILRTMGYNVKNSSMVLPMSSSVSGSMAGSKGWQGKLHVMTGVMVVSWILS
ncbi:hypothetical protein BJ684DRAFT_21093 [Piptocephalis cylindrospora]|uniref:Uncharacterized protein n=1 Tax=Piptocephalis cylindrospora TaxID=1907219 RepID=A0A4P9Y3F2_9FUNG|nr:hypothetical protein BJ684DRAFT_21093 [Piptocephalis cylindrospora]|eukprot:RKP12360.1 hypothetical protein BJ684DRAFT_21093 [Piptocephalis cylindrospora]